MLAVKHCVPDVPEADTPLLVSETIYLKHNANDLSPKIELAELDSRGWYVWYCLIIAVVVAAGSRDLTHAATRPTWALTFGQGLRWLLSWERPRVFSLKAAFHSPFTSPCIWKNCIWLLVSQIRLLIQAFQAVPYKRIYGPPKIILAVRILTIDVWLRPGPFLLPKTMSEFCLWKCTNKHLM